MRITPPLSPPPPPREKHRLVPGNGSTPKARVPGSMAPCASVGSTMMRDMPPRTNSRRQSALRPFLRTRRGAGPSPRRGQTRSQVAPNRPPGLRREELAGLGRDLRRLHPAGTGLREPTKRSSRRRPRSSPQARRARTAAPARPCRSRATATTEPPGAVYGSRILAASARYRPSSPIRSATCCGLGLLPGIQM